MDNTAYIKQCGLELTGDAEGIDADSNDENADQDVDNYSAHNN